MNQLTAQNDISDSTIASIILNGDLSKLDENQRVEYYKGYCKYLGLEPSAKPFEFLELVNGKEKKVILYCTRSGTQQLSYKNNVSHACVSREKVGDVYVVTMRAECNGRSTESIGAVPLVKEDGSWVDSPYGNGKKMFKGNGKYISLKPEDLANAFMKAETKAKRRATLDLLGLGITDETEIESIKGSHVKSINLEKKTVHTIEHKKKEAEAKEEIIDEGFENKFEEFWKKASSVDEFLKLRGWVRKHKPNEKDNKYYMDMIDHKENELLKKAGEFFEDEAA